MQLTVMSFSFKQGIPPEATTVFDVRFLKNPHYDPQLQPFNGCDERVGAYIETDPDFSTFFESVCHLIEPMLPRPGGEGKQDMHLAFGCTGGKHRSVYVAQKLAGFLQAKGYNVIIKHRDMQ